MALYLLFLGRPYYLPMTKFTSMLMWPLACLLLLSCDGDDPKAETNYYILNGEISQLFNASLVYEIVPRKDSQGNTFYRQQFTMTGGVEDQALKVLLSFIIASPQSTLSSGEYKVTLSDIDQRVGQMLSSRLMIGFDNGFNPDHRPGFDGYALDGTADVKFDGDMIVFDFNGTVTTYRNPDVLRDLRIHYEEKIDSYALTPQ